MRGERLSWSNSGPSDSNRGGGGRQSSLAGHKDEDAGEISSRRLLMCTGMLRPVHIVTVVSTGAGAPLAKQTSAV